MVIVNTYSLPAGQRPSSEGGFSLVELLIALLVFAVGVMAVVGLQTASIQGNMTSRLNTDWAARAVAQLEVLRGLDYDNADLDPAGNPHGTGGVVWNVTTQNAGAGNEYKTVQLTVNWEDHGESKSYTINFIRSESVDLP